MTTTPPLQTASEAWPPLPLEAWDDTRATLHLWTQMVGKTRLGLSPAENHYWHVASYVTSRGLTTSPIPHRGRTFEIEFDFIDHQLIARTSDGGGERIRLEPHPVAEFFDRYRAMLRSLDIEVKIFPRPSEIPDAVPFTQDRAHTSYDADAAHRFWRVLTRVDAVLKRFRGGFLGKSSPVHFWWGAMDLSHTRFSGRPAPLHPGGFPNLPDHVTREAYSHECMSVGWWPGGGPTPIREPSFYAYAYPEPVGCPDARVSPNGARYDLEMHEWLLPYEVVRRSSDPERALLEFAHSTYEAVATLGRWDRATLERSV